MQFLIDIILTLVYFLAFFLVCAWSWRFWMAYVNQKYLNKFGADSIMLEIKLPRDIMKSPFAMETALASLAQGGGVGSWYDRNFSGNLPAYFSLEIASLEGIIHFYVRLHKKFRELVEANLYAQYPGIEISEASDYTSRIRYHHLSKDVELWGASFPLVRKLVPVDVETGEPCKKDGKDYKMSADYLPLKTYVDYGLEKDPKEEFKIDPITPLLEFMGSVGKDEYVWYQILVQDESKFNDDNFPKTYVNELTHKHLSLKDLAEERKTQIRTAGFKKKGTPVADEQGYPVYERTEEGKEPKVKTWQKDTILFKKELEFSVEDKAELEQINRKLSKPLVRSIIRLIYVAKKDKFNYNHIQSVISIMKPFNGTDPAHNAFSLDPVTPYVFNWQDIGKRRSSWRKEEKFEAFVEREGFHPHIGERTSLDEWEDRLFWKSSMKKRKIFRMILEAIRYPFDHPQAKEVITLNLEELATLWHFPGQVAATPTLPRIDSTKGVAPVNLPQ